MERNPDNRFPRGIDPTQIVYPAEGDLPAVTWEEWFLTVPYNDRFLWRKTLALQLRSGKYRFRGPPGLLERMERLLSFITARKTDKG